jgi:hypothetical protein
MKRAISRVMLLAPLALVFGCGYQESMVALDPSAVLPECTVQPRQSMQDIIVRVTIANHTQRSFQLMSWNLPKSGRMTTDLFQVTRDGVPVQYTGIMMKREVTRSDYVSIPPGKAFSADIPLQQGYDVRPSGNYTIVYSAFNSQFDSPGVKNLVSMPATLTKH